MDQEFAAKLKASFSVRVFMQQDGWHAVPAAVKNGAIGIDVSQNTPTTGYNMEINFNERFREIGAGAILVGGEWSPIYHQAGLDTRWEASFVGNALPEAVRFTTREGENIDIAVRCVGAPKKEEAPAEEVLNVAVRTDYRLINVMWRGSDAVHGVVVTVKAVEVDDEYVVEAQRVPANKTFLAIDKLAAGKYTVEVCAHDAAGKELTKREVSVDVPRQ